MNKHAVLVSVVMLCLTQAGCKPEPAAEPRPSATPAAAGPEARPETVALVDVIETSPSRIIGISYPHDASIPAGLAGVLQQYAGQARDELQMALDGLGSHARCLRQAQRRGLFVSKVQQTRLVRGNSHCQNSTKTLGTSSAVPRR